MVSFSSWWFFFSSSFGLGLVDFGFKTDEIRALVALLALVVCLSWFFWQYQKPGWRFGFGQNASYQKGVDFFLAEKVPGPIFNNFDIGGYLDYRLYPERRVFVDNRPEAFPVSFFAETYKPMQLDEEKWHYQEKKWGFQTVIWSHSDITDWGKSFLDIISRQKDWDVVYLDQRMVIYQKKPSPEKVVDPEEVIRSLIDQKDKFGLQTLGRYFALTGQFDFYQKSMVAVRFLN